MSAVFECAGIELELGGRQILGGVSLGIAPAEILGIVGPNGAGKTSLFEVLCGRYRHSTGEVWLDGEAVGDRSFTERVRRGLARTFQSPIVPGALSVGETLNAARKARRPRHSRHAAEWSADLVGLAAPWTRPANTLDTFDRRKLLLACLMLRRPKVLLMDEPASGLINTEIDELDMIIRRLVDEYRLPVMLIEHRLELLSAVADRALVLDQGCVIATGTPQSVFADPAVQTAYFEAA